MMTAFLLIGALACAFWAVLSLCLFVCFLAASDGARAGRRW